MIRKQPAPARRDCPHCGAIPVPGAGPEGGATIHEEGCPRGGRTRIR
ncbi:hypothetical protein [Streptomyces sp. NPDC001568]